MPISLHSTTGVDASKYPIISLSYSSKISSSKTVKPFDITLKKLPIIGFEVGPGILNRLKYLRVFSHLKNLCLKIHQTNLLNFLKMINEENFHSLTYNSFQSQLLLKVMKFLLIFCR